MNGVEKVDGGVSNTLQIQEAALYAQEHSETQLHTVRVAAFTTKALGFTRSLVDAACLAESSFFYDFYSFGGIRSTQPTRN
ncbi:MAG: hypothetical protein OXH39_13295 [Candidatus Poribacteria bacterium]|nr:hypothetical protein [Candidatus Poribacteria bacterium]